MSNLKERLKELRLAKQLKQNEFAKHLDISDRTVRHYENGDREPDIDKLIEIADFFEVSLDYLVGRSDDPKKY